MSYDEKDNKEKNRYRNYTIAESKRIITVTEVHSAVNDWIWKLVPSELGRKPPAVKNWVASINILQSGAGAVVAK